MIRNAHPKQVKKGGQQSVVVINQKILIHR